MFKSGLNCKGVTILEGLIALTLLALVATGTFSVLLSTSRKSNTPDIREEMVLAVDRAASLLQAYVVSAEGVSDWQGNSELKNGLCPDEADSSPLSLGTHQISCLLPPLCDARNSSFSYDVSAAIKTFDIKQDDLMLVGSAIRESPTQNMKNVEFKITCNGFTL